MKFGQLKELFEYKAQQVAKEDDPSTRFRVAGYQRIANIIDNEYKASELVTKSKIDALPITNHMKEKALNYSKRAPLSSRNKKMLHNVNDTNNVDNTNNADKDSIKTPKEKLLRELTNIMGIGDVRAKELVKMGVKNLTDLNKFKNKLPQETKLFMKHKPMIIPHEEIKSIEKVLHKLESDDRKIQIVGSYRRKKPYSKDIDVMVVTSKNVMNDILEHMKPLFKNVFPYSMGDDKMSLLIEYNNKFYKLDIFAVKPSEYIPTLLYATGSKEFNIAMRQRAKSMGYLLNQNGLFDKKTNKLVMGLHSEKDYFDKLGMEYKSPEDR